MFSDSSRRIRVGDGGAPPAATRTWWERGAALESLASMISTVGAALKLVIRSLSSSCQISEGSIRGTQMLAAPAAAIAHVWLQPLQWNMGRVHRCRVADVSRLSITM